MFVNETNPLSFDDAEDRPATQELELDFDSLNKPLPLRFVKFQKVNNLTIFVKVTVFFLFVFDFINNKQQFISTFLTHQYRGRGRLTVGQHLFAPTSAVLGQSRGRRRDSGVSHPIHWSICLADEYV